MSYSTLFMRFPFASSTKDEAEALSVPILEPDGPELKRFDAVPLVSTLMISIGVMTEVVSFVFSLLALES